MSALRHGKNVNLEGVAHRLLDFCERHDLYVTSGREGLHNPGSDHYIGHAVDFRTRTMTEKRFQFIVAEAAKEGLHVRDERKRPKGQAVWGGPHGHLGFA
jgi:hypothetical protein